MRGWMTDKISTYNEHRIQQEETDWYCDAIRVLQRVGRGSIIRSFLKDYRIELHELLDTHTAIDQEED